MRNPCNEHEHPKTTRHSTFRTFPFAFSIGRKISICSTLRNTADLWAVPRDLASQNCQQNIATSSQKRKRSCLDVCPILLGSQLGKQNCWRSSETPLPSSFAIFAGLCLECSQNVYSWLCPKTTSTTYILIHVMYNVCITLVLISVNISTHAVIIHYHYSPCHLIFPTEFGLLGRYHQQSATSVKPESHRRLSEKINLMKKMCSFKKSFSTLNILKPCCFTQLLPDFSNCKPVNPTIKSWRPSRKEDRTKGLGSFEALHLITGQSWPHRVLFKTSCIQTCGIYRDCTVMLVI